MQGQFSIRIDRHPDFFSLLKARGSYFTIVAENEVGEILGSFSCATQHCHTSYGTKNVSYLGDLKVHPCYSGTRIAFRLVKEMHQFLLNQGANFLVCTAVSDNKTILPFFRGRAGIPFFCEAGQFSVHQVLPRKSGVNSEPDKANSGLPAFYEAFNLRYSFSPTVDLTPSCTHFTAYENEKLVAAVTVFDPVEFKQNVLVRCPFWIDIGLSLMRPLQSLLNWSELPRKGSPIRVLYVKYQAFLSGKEKAYLHLLKRIRSYAFEHRYHFISVAVHDRDLVVSDLIRPISRYRIKSSLFIASLLDNIEQVKSICGGLLNEDYSLV